MKHDSTAHVSGNGKESLRIFLVLEAHDGSYGVPSTVCGHSPFSMNTAFSHVRMSRRDPLVRDPALEKPLQQALIKFGEEVADARVAHGRPCLPPPQAAWAG